MSCLSPRSLLSEKREKSEAMVLEIMKHLNGDRQNEIKEEIERSGGDVDMVDFARFLKHLLLDAMCSKDDSKEEIDVIGEEIVSNLCELFKAIDINGDGTLEWDEFTSFIVEKASVYNDASAAEDDSAKFTGVKLKVSEKGDKKRIPMHDGDENTSTEDVPVRIGVSSGKDADDENPINKTYYVDALDSLMILRQNCETVKIYDAKDMSELGRLSGLGGLPICAEYMSGWSSRFKEEEIKRKIQLEAQKYKIGRPHGQSSSSSFGSSKTKKSDMQDFDVRGNAGHVATACSDMTINIWDLQPGANQYQVVSRWRAPHAQVALCWVKEHQTLFSAGASGLVHSWDVNKRLEKSYFLAHDDIATALVSLPDLDNLISGGMDSMVCIWDMHTGVQQQVFHGHKRGVLSLAYCETDRLIVSAGIDHDAFVWSPFAPTLLYKLKGHKDSLIGVHNVQNNPHQVITADAAGVFKIWDLRTYQAIETFSIDPEEIPPLQTVNSFAVCPGKVLPRNGESGSINHQEAIAKASSNEDSSNSYVTRIAACTNTIHFMDQNDPVDDMVTDNFPIISALFNSTFLSIITAAGRTVKTWNALTGKRLNIFSKVTNSDITCMCLDDRERKFILGDHAGNISVFNYANGALMKTMVPHLSEVSSLQYCLNHKAVLSTSWDRVISVHSELDPEKGIKLREMDPLHIHDDDITTSDMSEKLGLCVSGSLDNDFKVWNFDSGNLHGKGSHAADITQVKFLGDSRILAVADNLGLIQFWALHSPPQKYEKLGIIEHFRYLKYGKPEINPGDEEKEESSQEISDTDGEEKTKSLDRDEEKVEESKISQVEGIQAKHVCLNNKDDELSTVLAMAWSEKEKLLVFGDEFGTLRAFRINNCMENFSVEFAWNSEGAHSDGITSVHVPEGFDFVLSSGFDCSVRTCGLQDGNNYGVLIEGSGKLLNRSQFWDLPFPNMDDIITKNQKATRRVIQEIEKREAGFPLEESESEHKVTEPVSETDEVECNEEKLEHFDEIAMTPRSKRRQVLLDML